MKIMKAILSAAVVVSAAGCGGGGVQQPSQSNEPIIGKQRIEIKEGRLTPEIMHMMGKVSDPQVSPNGKHILYGVTYTSIEQNKGNRELFLINADGSGNVQLMSTPKSESNARWVDDSKIAYMRGGQIFVADLSTDCTKLINEKQMSAFVEGEEADAFELSADASKIMYIKNIKANIVPTDLYPDLKKATGRTITGLMYRHWDHFVETIPHTFIADFNTEAQGAIIKPGSVASPGLINEKDILLPNEAAFELPTLPFGGLEQLSWSPNGKMIAYSCRKLTGKDYAFSTNTSIYLYNVESGETQIITPGVHGYDTDPSFSPDGSKLAYISMERDGYEADKKRLFVYDMQSGAKSELTTDYKYNVESVTWAPDGNSIYFTSCVNGLTAIFNVDVNKKLGGAIADNLATGPIDDSFNYGEGIRRVTSVSVMNDFDAPAILPLEDGSYRLVATNKSMLRPNEIVSVDPATGAVTELTQENKEILEGLDTPTVEARWMKTVDNKNMLTWIVYPPHFDKSKVYPAIMMCLGGPQGTISQGFSTRWNYRLMAQQGYIVILPNRRGTTAFGQPWCEQISGDYCGLNMQDYLTAVDEMKKEPYVGKVAATGASYGGYSVYYLAGIHKNRFSALIAHAGIFNQESMYMMTEEMWFPNWDNGGAPWDTNPVAVRHYSNSPHKLIKNWNTPILITHGEMDYRVPVDQGMQAFNAAQMMGVPSRMILFPEENHWILRPQNSVQWNREFFGWLDKYCK